MASQKRDPQSPWTRATKKRGSIARWSDEAHVCEACRVSSRVLAGHSVDSQAMKPIASMHDTIEWLAAPAPFPGRP